MSIWENLFIDDAKRMNSYSSIRFMHIRGVPIKRKSFVILKEDSDFFSH